MYGSRPSGLREVKKLIADFNHREAGLGVTTWAVALQGSEDAIGWCGYGRTNAAWLNPNLVEIGWLIEHSRWGQVLRPKPLPRLSDWASAS